MSDSPTPAVPGGADAPPGATPEVSGPVVTVGRSVGLAIVAILVSLGLTLLIAPPIAERICAGIEPSSGDPVGDIFAVAIGCLFAALAVFVLLYLVLLVTLLLVMSTLGWTVWGRSTFIWTIVAGLGLTLMAVVVMGIIGD